MFLGESLLELLESTANFTYVHQTLSKAEQIADNYVNKANHEKLKLLKIPDIFQKSPTFQLTYNAIYKRQMNIIQCAQYDIEQRLNILFKERVTRNI